MTNHEKMTDMNIQERAIFIHDFYIKHNHITINDFEEWLSEKAKPTLAEAERAILENIDKDYKWIARDEGGYLYIHQTKPSKVDCQWQNKERFLDLESFNHLFQFITWQDDEPYNIEELLNGKI